jgi:hypothetical protein
VKVQPGFTTLCVRCEYGQVVTFRNDSTTVICHHGMHPWKVYRSVVQCNEFEDRNTASKHDMEKIAWVVRTDKSGKAIGFTPPVTKDDL